MAKATILPPPLRLFRYKHILSPSVGVELNDRTADVPRSTVPAYLGHTSVNRTWLQLGHTTVDLGHTSGDLGHTSVTPRSIPNTPRSNPVTPRSTSVNPSHTSVDLGHT